MSVVITDYFWTTIAIKVFASEKLAITPIFVMFSSLKGEPDSNKWNGSYPYLCQKQQPKTFFLSLRHSHKGGMKNEVRKRRSPLVEDISVLYQDLNQDFSDSPCKRSSLLLEDSFLTLPQGITQRIVGGLIMLVLFFLTRLPMELWQSTSQSRLDRLSVALKQQLSSPSDTCLGASAAMCCKRLSKHCNSHVPQFGLFNLAGRTNQLGCLFLSHSAYVSVT